MDELARWYGEQLDKDERIAAGARDAEFCKNGSWVAKGPFEDKLGSVHSESSEALLGEEENVPFAIAAHVAAHDPARVLREVEAGRRLLGAHAKWCQGECEATYPEASLDAAHYWNIKLRAAVYSDRPGYREEWTP